MGGSERERALTPRPDAWTSWNISRDQMDWYVNLRCFGGMHAPVSAWAGRLIMYLTDIENIRDVIPHPRARRATASS